MTCRPLPEILIIEETALQSMVSDGVTLAMFAAMVGLGVALGSETMQYLGGSLFLVWLCIRRRKPRLSIAQARRRLDEIEEARRHG